MDGVSRGGKSMVIVMNVYGYAGFKRMLLIWRRVRSKKGGRSKGGGSSNIYVGSRCGGYRRRSGYDGVTRQWL